MGEKKKKVFMAQVRNFFFWSKVSIISLRLFNSINKSEHFSENTITLRSVSHRKDRSQPPSERKEELIIYDNAWVAPPVYWLFFFLSSEQKKKKEREGKKKLGAPSVDIQSLFWQQLQRNLWWKWSSFLSSAALQTLPSCLPPLFLSLTTHCVCMCVYRAVQCVEGAAVWTGVQEEQPRQMCSLSARHEPRRLALHTSPLCSKVAHHTESHT